MEDLLTLGRELTDWPSFCFERKKKRPKQKKTKTNGKADRERDAKMSV